MKQCDIRAFFKRAHPSKPRTKQLSIERAMANLKYRRKQQQKSKHQLYRAFKQPLGYTKYRFRNGIAYLYSLEQGNLDLTAFDIKTHKKVGDCVFTNLVLSHIHIETLYRHKRIGLTFLKIANMLTASRVLFCPTLSRKSDCQICTDGMGLLRYAHRKNIIKPDQFIKREPIFPVALPGYNLRPRKPKCF